MKRILSVLLALVMVMSLAGVMGVSALAAEDELTIVLTGGTGSAIDAEGLSFATAAAIKETYDDNAVLLVDAGGFDAGAGAIMTAAGYDLVVPGGVMDDWAVTSIAMNNGVLKPGAMFEKNGVKLAFVAVEPMGDMDEEAYYDTLQGAVTGARDTGAEYVIALGRVDDANAVIANVDGIDAILTYGGTAIKALPGEITEEAETEEVAEVEDGEEAPIEESGEEPAADGESEQPAQALYVSVGSEFGSIGIVSIKGNMLYAETVNAESAEALELNESSAILALEAAFQAAQPQDEAEAATEPAEGEEPAGETNEFAEEGEEIVEDGETAEETEPTEDGETAEEESTADAEPVKEDGAEETQETEETTEETAQETEESADGAAEETTEETAEQSEETAADAEQTEEKTEEQAEAEPTPVIDAASESDAEDTEKKDEEEPAAAEPTPVIDAASSDTAAPAGNAPTEYIRGNDDLELTFEHAVKEVQIKDNKEFKEFEAKYYELSDGDKTVAISSSVLNDWPDGNFEFRILFADGTEAETVLVKISGEKPEPEQKDEPADEKKSDDSSSKKEESKATPAPTKQQTKKASTPATGDTSPIGLYAAILGVMVVALVVVIVLVVRKKKMEK